VRKELEISFSPRASADIDRIYDYTEDRWGSEQADRYTLELKLACNGLIEIPRLGRPANTIRAGYFVLGCGSHNIFFRKEKTRIVIVRILHNRMDPMRHLKGKR